MASIPNVSLEVIQTNEEPAEKADLTLKLILQNHESFVGVNPNKFPVIMTLFVGNENNEVVFYRRFL